MNGTNGRNGTNSADGVSVTSANEPAGSNCTNGGSKFTAANGTTYACNGADGGGAALRGREVVHVHAEPVCYAVYYYVCTNYGYGEATATCPAGKVATAGGSDGDDRPEGSNAWFERSETTDSGVDVWVVCFNA